MPFDNYKNFVLVTVPQGYEASDTSVTLSPEDIARLPAAPFNLTWWDSTNYSTPSLDPNREIVRVSAPPSGTLVSINRAQENTTATDKNTPDATYSMLAAATEKFFADLEAEIAVLFAGDAAFDARLDTAEGAITTLQAADVALDTRVDALEAGGGGSSQEIDVTAAPYNALGDGVEFLDGVSTASSTTFTSATANFTAADIGKRIWIERVGPAGAFGDFEYGGAPMRAPLVTTITARANATTITVAAAPQVSLTALRFLYGSDDTAALQSAFDDLNPFGGQKLLLPPRIYFTSGPLTIQRYNGDMDWHYGGTKSAVILISGYGATIMCHTNNNFIQIAPNTQESFFHSPIIEGLRFEGIAGAAQTAISLECTFGAVVRDVRILRVGIGMELRGMLHGYVTNCIVDYFMTYGVVLGNSVVFPGGMVTNVSIVDTVRCGPASPALASFYLEDTDMCELLNCVSESAWATSMVACVHFKTLTLASYARRFKVENFYSEIHPLSGAVIKVISNGSTIIEGLHRYKEPGAPLVDVTGSAASSVVVRDLKVIKADGADVNEWVRFKQDAADSVGWLFENAGEFATSEARDLSEPEFWSGGVVPAKLTHIEPGRVITTGAGSSALPAPEILTATCGAPTTSTLALTFDQTVKAPDYLQGVSVKVNGTARTITSATRQANKAMIYYVLSSPIIGTDTITFSYVAEDGFIESASTGLNFASFTDNAVTNVIGVVVLLHDTFTDADNTLLQAHTMNVGPGWTAVTLFRSLPDMHGAPLPEPRAGLPPRIISNIVETRQDNNVAYDFLVDAGVSDFIAEIDVMFSRANIAASAGLSCSFFKLIRYVDSNNFWALGFTDAVNSNVLIYRNVAGVFSLINSRTQAIVADTPYKMIVSAISADWEFTIAGTTMSFTDSAHQTATKVGLEFVTNAAFPVKADNFRVIAVP